MLLFAKATDLANNAALLRKRRFGVIEVVDGRLMGVMLRPWPKILVGPEVLWWGKWWHERRDGDRLLIYYNQPLRFSNFLALAYVVSASETSMRSIRVGAEALDEIARLKRSDALLCDVSNWRISRRFMQRLGWEPHCPSRWHRHYIKRFYGNYPPRPEWVQAEYADLVGIPTQRASEEIDLLPSYGSAEATFTA